MKLYLSIIGLILLGIIFNFINYGYFELLLSIIWYIASVLIVYMAIKYTYKYKFIQLNIKRIIEGIKSKSKSGISPISSLCISLAAKIGVGSLSGVALCLYYGGVGSIFWLCVISIIISINTYQECILGIKYREKDNDSYVGGPSYYISKCLNNRKLGKLYGFLVIITYSGFFLSIQSNTIINTVSYFDVNKLYIVIILLVGTFLIILFGIKGISLVNNKLVPIMIIFYMILGGYVFINNYSNMLNIFKVVIREAFKLKSIIPVFLVGMQRAIFITESSIGTSAISASSCDNQGEKQGMLEVLGIYIITFIICFTTFLIIVTSDYRGMEFSNLNGIEIVMHAFNYHFGNIGIVNLAIITIMFAYSTIISSYFFGISNLKIFSNKKIVRYIYMIFFMLVIFISCYVKANILWNLCDYFIALMAIINVISLLIIGKKKDFQDIT